MIIKFFNYIKRVFMWFATGKYHILTFSVVLITLLYLFKIVSIYATYVSYFLMILGLFIILTQQLNDAHNYSDYKPNTISNWLKSFPSLKPTVYDIVGSGGMSVSGKAFLTISISENQPLEKKIAFLLSEVEKINKQIYDLDNKIDKTNKDLINSSNNLRNHIAEVHKTINNVMAGHIVGSYDINLFGIFATLCGTIIQIFYANTP